MERTETIGDPVRRAPSTGGTYTPGWDLPPSLFKQAVRRLHLFCGLYAVMFILAYFTPTVLLYGLSGILRQKVESSSAILSILFSLFVFLWTRRECCTAVQILNLALIYEVVACFGISVSEYWGLLGPGRNPLGLTVDQLPLGGISWVCVVVAVFPLIVPGTPRKVILGAFFAASTGPIVVLVSAMTGSSPSVPPMGMIVLFLPSYLCTLMAYFNARIVHGLGAAVTKARELGSYQLMGLLGRGGMGEVWRARHRMLARPAAIKLVTPQALGGTDKAEVVLQRFEREAQATAILHSPHTIHIYDFGITDEGRFYYVMEFLTGLDLESLIKRYGPVCQERMVFMLKQVCHSLMEAHEKYLIHRDIKPANIYACRYGRDFDFIKVLDFGLVKSNDAVRDADGNLTIEGRAYGTPAYIAPEMGLGKTDIDARADIYSLGCVAFWLITGRRLFESETPMAMVVDHIKTPPPRPSQHTELRLSPDVEEIILSCLEKDPAKRPQTAQAVLQALEECSASRGWASEQAKQWWLLHDPEAEFAHGEDEETDPIR